MSRAERLGAPGTLRRQVAGGLSWSALNSLVSRAGQLAVGIVMARLLAPRDFGVFAVALVAFTVVMSVNELGVSVAVVRWPGDVRRIAPTVTTLAAVSSAGFTALCVALSPWLAGALGAPEAAGVLRVLSLAVLVAGISAVPAGLIQREFLQGRKMAADTANLVVSTAVAVVLAVNGFGVWSLAWSRVAGNTASTALLFALAPERFAPGFDRAQARRLLAFGLPLAGASALVFCVLSVDYVVVGRLLGPVELGFYLLAFNLSSWPVTALSSTVRSVALPWFARLQHDPEQLPEGFLTSLGLVMAATIGVCVLLAALAGPLIRLVYGARWGHAADALVFLAALGAARVLQELAYDFLTAMGAVRATLRLQVLWLVALVPALAVGAREAGIAGVGAAHVAVALLVVLPAHLLVLRRRGVNLGLVAARLRVPLLAGVAAAAVVVGVGAVVRSDLAHLLLGGLLGAGTYLAILAAAWPHRPSSRLPATVLATTGAP